MRNQNIWLAAFSILAFSGNSIAASNPLFDKPLKVAHVPLPRDPDNPQAKAELTCTYYNGFTVKQIDLGEVGADQLSILPGAPTCRRQNATNEKIVSSSDWSGYFNGVKGGYVFFDADDGWNDGMGIAVFTPIAKKILEDVSKKWRAVEVTPSGITLRYVRVYGAKCSLLSGGAECWQQIKRDTGLTDAIPPDCTAAYAREQKRTPKFAKEVLTDPTIIDYEASVIITGQAYKIAPVTGKVLGCRPAE